MKKVLFISTVLLLSSQIFAQSKWFEAQHVSAAVKSVTATSELVEAQFDGKYLYPPINILDGDFNNTWCEADQKGSGIGESITVEFEEPVSFDEIQIVNGFVCKDYYLKNNRVKTIQLTQVAKEHFQQKEYTLQDNVQDWQSIKFDLLQTAQTITIELKDVYRGSKYDDTCLDDIRLLYKGKVIPFKNVENLKAVQIENSKQMLNSNAEDFKKQLFALASKVPARFINENVKFIFLKSEKDKSCTILGFSEDGHFKYIDYGVILSKEEFTKDYNGRNKTDDYYWSWYHQDDAFDYSPYSIFVTGFYSPYTWGTRYELGNSRIITTTTIDYVKVKTPTLLKIDGNSVFIDGVKYSVVDPKTILDCRIYDGA